MQETNSKNKSDQKQIIKAVVMGLLVAFALSFSGTFCREESFLQTVRSEMDGVGLDKFILVFALSLFFWKTDKTWLEDQTGKTHKTGRTWPINVLAVVFSGCMLIGLSFTQNGDWSFLLGNFYQILVAVLLFVGFFLLFQRGIVLFYYLLNEIKWRPLERNMEKKSWRTQHYFAWCCLIMGLCWLPYLIAFFPGSVPHDGYAQLNMAFGINKMTNQHSWSLTMIFGAIMWIGRQVSDNFGVFLIVFSTSVVEVLCYSKVCCNLRKWGAPIWLQKGTLCFFAVTPVFGAYAQAVIKDSIYVALFTLYISIYIEVCLQYLRKQKNRMEHPFLALFFLGFLICIFRNNGVYLILPASFLLVFLIDKKERKHAVVVTIALLVCFGGYKQVLTPMMGVTKESGRALWSIPFQQTARYLRDYPEDVTDKEKSAIDKILAYDKLGENYNPELSDPVKNTYNNGATTQDMIYYLKAWFRMLRKHPGVYIQATLHNTYGYYYPFYNYNGMGAYQFYIKGEPVATGYFDIHYVMPTALRKVFMNYSECWRNLPGLAQLMNPGTYTWLLLLLAGYLICRKRTGGILALAAPALNVAVCIASPVNGLLRYAWPVMACMPILLFWCLAYGKEGEEKNDEEESRSVNLS